MKWGVKTAVFPIIGTGMVCMIGGYILMHLETAGSSSALNSQIAAARKAGVPLEYSELDIRHVPTDQNAAPIYTQAAVILNQFAQDSLRITKALSLNATPKDVEAADSDLAYLKPTFDLLATVDKTSGCDFNRNWRLSPRVIFPEISGLKHDVEALCFQANFLDRNGDSTDALKAMGTAWRVAKDSGTDPVLIGMLGEVACRAIINTEWEDLIRRHSTDSLFLELIEQRLKVQTDLPPLKRYLAGEIVLGRKTIQTMSSNSELGSPGRPSVFDSEVFRSSGLKDTFEAKFLDEWCKTWPKLPSDPNDWQGCTNVLHQMSQDIDRDHSVSTVLSQVLRPVFSEPGTVLGLLQSHQRLLETTISLLKIRNQTRKLPKVLPLSLVSNAIDPFDGNLLRYRRNGNGFVIYSIGADRVDNEGKPRGISVEDSGFDEVIEIH